MNARLVVISGLFMLMSTIMFSPTFAEQSSEIVSTNVNTNLIKTSIPMYISSDNTLPWASISGIVDNHADGYPVIIQIYQDGQEVHFAQTDVNEEGYYEYQFRIRSVDGDNVVKVFEGNYDVKIFKTINANYNSSI